MNRFLFGYRWDLSLLPAFSMSYFFKPKRVVSKMSFIVIENATFDKSSLPMMEVSIS